MNKVREFTIETAHALFDLRIFAAEDGKNFVGQYIATTQKLMEHVRPTASTATMQGIGEGKRTDQDLDRLIATCRAEIEKMDGKILGTTERDAKISQPA